MLYQGPIREGGIQLLLQTVTCHRRDALVLRAAVRVFTNLLDTYASLAAAVTRTSKIDTPPPPSQCACLSPLVIRIDVRICEYIVFWLLLLHKY